MIINDETGMLILPNDSISLANVIINLIKQPKKIKEMGIKARERIKSKFTIEKNVESIKKIYKKLVKK